MEIENGGCGSSRSGLGGHFCLVLLLTAAGAGFGCSSSGGQPDGSLALVDGGDGGGGIADSGLDSGVDAGDAGHDGGNGNPCADGGCGSACTTNGDCANSPTPFCNTTTFKCAACLPASSSVGDTCTGFTYCASTSTCVPGCQGATSCKLQECGATHDCAPCVSDSECAGGRVCDQGLCAAPCTQASDCGSGQTCCAPHCSVLAHDIQNCGACGTACTTDQFCSGTACEAVSFANLCANPVSTVLLDGIPDDDDGGLVVGAALQASCGATVVSFVSQDVDAGVLDLANNAPVIGGGDLLVSMGGPFGQHLVSYLETSASPVYFTTSGTGSAQMVGFLDRDGGQPLISVPASAVGPDGDYFVLELVRDPYSGTLTFVGYGLTGYGTDAAAWYVQNELLPTPDATSWRVVDWVSNSAGAGPYSGDTFTTVASGP